MVKCGQMQPVLRLKVTVYQWRWILSFHTMRNYQITLQRWCQPAEALQQQQQATQRQTDTQETNKRTSTAHHFYQSTHKCRGGSMCVWFLLNCNYATNAVFYILLHNILACRFICFHSKRNSNYQLSLVLTISSYYLNNTGYRVMTLMICIITITSMSEWLCS